ncbi:oxidase [Lithospermum erythrorhizon]|uniref:Oxidase n=1 Tax=Lithospermum erythrorhizon TaxID=34254 RepID=A0AAV3RT54_LITER
MMRTPCMQSWHLDGYDFWVVGFGNGKWGPDRRKRYNLADALTSHTTQATTPTPPSSSVTEFTNWSINLRLKSELAGFTNSWTAILVSLDNQGMWNLRSEMWARQYLGQQFYVRIYDRVKSLTNEYDILNNALLCGRAAIRRP